MTVDAFYTSPIGIQDVGYQGNQAVSQYEVPESIIQEALRRSPFWRRVREALSSGGYHDTYPFSR